MQLPIQPLERHGPSLQDQLFDRFLGLLAAGRLSSGARMPATRQLALDLGVSRNTVVLTYERLAAEGFIEMQGPRGAFITAHGAELQLARERALDETESEPLSSAGDAGLQFDGGGHVMRPPHAGELVYDFWVGRPDMRLFPALAWRRLINEALIEMQDSDGSYGDPAGLPRLRAAVARHIGQSRGIVCTADDVIITNGIQEGINIVARLLVGAGTPVGMECPGYLGGANVLASFGAQLVPVHIDAEGAQPGQLPPDCRLMYLTPAHQYPTGVALTPERRHAWLQWAQAQDGYLIEDDYDSDFYYDSVPPPAIKAQDEHGRVIYLGTFSKSLSAGLRMGYMVAPRQLRAAAVGVKNLLTNGSPLLTQMTLAAFIGNGLYARQLRRLRVMYGARRDALRGALTDLFGSATLTGGQAGMHVLWQLPPALPDAAEIEQAARSVGVGIYQVDHCNGWLDEACRERARRFVLLGYAALNAAEIRAGLTRLQQALHEAGAVCAE